ncbi:hypothetical protein LTR04_005239 [Oleoguttula sp. CCFEE 6159]|nr:hypothetical protein LTR04_005239 [Oleoguttula sp. CCFEE 6159]
MQKPSQRCDTASAKQNKPDHKATPGNGRFSGKENDLEIGDRRILAAAVTSRHLIVEVERSSQQRAASSAVKRSAAIESARETGKFQDTLGEVLIRTANDEPTFSVWEAVQQSAERCSRLTLEPLSKSAKSRKRQKSVKTRKQNFVSIVYENPPEASKQLAPPAETMHRQLQNWPTSTSSPFLYRKNPAGGQNLETSQPWARPFKHRPRLMTSESSPAILAPLVSVPLSSKTSRIIVTEQADGANFPAIEMSFGSNGSFGHGWGLIGQYTNSIVPLANATSGNAESVRQDLREDMQLSGEVDSCSPSPGKLCDIRETTMKCLTSDQAMRSDEKTAAPKHSSVDIHTSPFVIFNTQAAIHDAQLALVEDLTSPVKKALSPVPVQRLSLSRQAQDTVAKTITPFHELNSSISREIREEQYDIPLPSTQALFDAASPFFASTVKKPIAGRASGLEKTQDKVSRYTTRERNAVSSESPTMIDDTSNRLEAVGSNETIESYCNPTTEPGLEPGRGSSPFNRYNEAFLSTHLSDGNASVTPLAETSKIKPDSSWLHTGLDTREKSQTRTNKPTARPAGDISSAQATTIAFSQHGKRIETWSAMLDSSLQQRIHDQ